MTIVFLPHLFAKPSPVFRVRWVSLRPVFEDYPRTGKGIEGRAADEVFLMCREAIINACRHARATHIGVEARYWPTELHIVVRDNGCGIHPHTLRWGGNEHQGLRGMRQRAEKIGARLRLRSRERAGTEVELFVPNHGAFQLQSSQSLLGWLASIDLRRRACAIQ